MELLLGLVLVLLDQMWMAEADSVIEEVNDRQLEKMVEENDFVAVAWFTKSCK
jgi:hypothetical protein